MIDWYETLDKTLQTTIISAIISAITSIIILLITWITGIFKEQYSLNYKLKKEYEFEQRKKLKDEISKTKIPLLNSIEELNYRIYNLNTNLHLGWQNVAKEDWFRNEQYFVNSSIYRLLEFWYWIIKTEKDTISIDSTIADNDDILYLTYIKTFKNVFTDVDILKDLGYSPAYDTNHFFKNDLETYGSWLIENNEIIGFEKFKGKLGSDYDKYKKVIEYFTNIQNDDTDKNLNVLRSFQLIAISFLNKYGHGYQKTDSEKLRQLTESYKQQLKVKVAFKNFIVKNKLNKEMTKILRAIK